MSAHDLNALLRTFERQGDLKRVKAPVGLDGEVTEIVTRVVKAAGPALLFERPGGRDIPLAINVFGTEKRMATALGVQNLDEIGDRIAALLKPEIPHGPGGLWEAMGKLASLRGVPPKRVGRAPVQEIVLKGSDVDLDILPGLKAWPDDGGAFLNLGLTHTKHPETGARNLGMYRLQQHDNRTLGMHWQIHKDSNAHHAIAERRGERLPVAIAFGCPAAVTYCRQRAAAGGDRRVPVRRVHRAVARSRWSTACRCRCRCRPPAQVVLEGWLEPGVAVAG